MALVLCLIVVLAQVLIPDFRRPVADATTYSRIAVGLVDAVRYSDAGIAALFGGGYSPAYTAFLAVAAMADDTILSALTCVQDVKAACDLSGLSPLFAAQALMTGMTVFFLFLATRLLVEDRRVVWLTLFIVLGSKTFSNYASLVLTESLAFFLYFFFAWMFARILTSDRPGGLLFLGAGLGLGALALARPSYQYLIPFAGVVVVTWRVFWQRTRLGPSLGGPAIMLAAAGAILLPVVVHNYFSIGQATISTFGPRVLIERLAYNTMTWAEWGVSFIYWLPDFGDNLARSLFAEDLWKRLTWYDLSSFYMMGRGDFFKEVYSQAGRQGQGQGLGYLLREYIWSDLGKHLSVTISLAMRGQWVGNYVSLVGFVLLPVTLCILRRRRRAAAFVVYCLPVYFMLGFYAFVSVNVVRYNEPLIAIFALSIAVVIVRLAEFGWARLRQTRNQS